MKEVLDKKKILAKLLLLIASKKKNSFFLFLILTLLTSAIEIFSIGILIPFADLMINPDRVIAYLKIFKILDLDLFKKETILFTIVLLLVGSIILAAFLKTLLLVLNTKISANIDRDLNLKIFSSLLNQQDLSNSKLSINNINSILSKTHDVSDVTNAVLSGLASIFITIFIFLLMLTINFKITVLSFLIFLGIYYFIVKFSKNITLKSSNEISHYTDLKYKTFHNASSLIKFILIHDLRKFFKDELIFAENKIYDAKIKTNFYSFFPGLLIVNTTIIILILAITYYSLIKGSLLDKLAIFAALAFSAQKILPYLAQIYHAISKCRGHYYNVNSVINFILFLDSNISLLSKKNSSITFNNILEFKNINFSYSKKNLFKNLNLKIKKNKKILIKGRSGIGKSTLFNLIFGFINFQEGNIKIDNQNVKKENLIHFRKNISYVPQDVFLCEGTISENIALGIKKNKINYKAIKKCLALADFKEILLKEGGFDHKINYGGSNLSSGQKQRIGLARALYFKPNILFLDEATNSLDKNTEKKVFENLQLIKNLTLIVIAHKTVNEKFFNERYMLKNKKLIKY